MYEAQSMENYMLCTKNSTTKTMISKQTTVISVHFDYLLNSAQERFSYNVLLLNLPCCQGISFQLRNLLPVQCMLGNLTIDKVADR